MKFTRSLNAGARRDYFLPERKSDRDNENNQKAAAMRGPGGTRREGFPAAGGSGDLEDGGDDVGVGDNCRDQRTKKNKNSH